MAQERDPDLQALFEAADHISAIGVRALVDKLQGYRRSARDACNFVAILNQNSEMVSNVAMLRSRLAEIDQLLAQWQWQMELDHIEARDFIE